MRISNFIDQLQQLFPLSFTQVQKADSDAAGIVDCLRYAREAKRQPFYTKVDFDAPENSHGKWPVRVNAAAAKTDIDNASPDISGQVHKSDDHRKIKPLPRLQTAPLMRIRKRGSPQRKNQGRPRLWSAPPLRDTPRLLARNALMAARQLPRPLGCWSLVFSAAQPIVLIHVTRGAERLVVEALPAD